MIKLLIADDEMIEREAIQFIIAANFPDCFEIREAGNGREAVETARQFHPDLIFLDIEMPGLNGLDAARQIREIVPECRIIIVSAYHYFNYAQNAISLGTEEYITKPAPPAKIVETLTRVLQSIDAHRLKKIQDMETARRLEKISQYLKDELIIRIVLGELDVATTKQYFDMLQLNFQALLFAVLRITKPNAATTPSEIDRTLLQNDLLPYLQKELAELGHNVLIRPVGTEIYLLLLIQQKLDEYQSRVFGLNLFSRVKENIFHKFGLTVNIGIGNVTHTPENIYNAFLQAKQSLHYDLTPGTITSFGDISQDQTDSAYPLYREQQMLDEMVQGNQRASLELLDQLLEWLSAHYHENQVFMQKVYELLLTLVRGIRLNTNINEFSTDPKELRHAVFSLQTFTEARTFANNFVTSKINELKHIKKSRAGALLSLVTSYLEKNYAKEISLEDVAQTVQISPFYLSKLFKKELGENFIDYLTGIRIRKAKEILANPLHTVKDTSYMVGYKDPNYFARVFKKISGLTPTEYQAKLM